MSVDGLDAGKSMPAAAKLNSPTSAEWLRHTSSYVAHCSSVNRFYFGSPGCGGNVLRGLILDIVEVKTHDAGVLYSVTDGIISGNPVNQVMATYRAIVSIFGGTEAEDSPLVRPRREVLRNHFYQACLRDSDAEFKQHWHSLLNDLFDRKVSLKIQAEIVRVQLASVAPSEQATFVTQEGIPIVVRTLNAEEVGLTLKERERKPTTQRSESFSQPIPQATQSVAPELDPATAFHKLQPTSSSTASVIESEPASDEIQVEAVDRSNELVIAKPKKTIEPEVEIGAEDELENPSTDSGAIETPGEARSPKFSFCSVRGCSTR